ncbi:hypothetical protein H1P_2740005 [Hyella patelloides LEGE 07179]|uniref:Pyrrolo-quinoline quinone repeat domain-containing protein n=1 Tax=Hyella patelloides LEGE 07179 TaxID=945734 RepID=A0A563VT57_9CYAN|nr:PQQ-binding-like beta-propeller repeat protein [Hyella patelloides]VEP14603.1 hypothetical protein H1P_2740005 [Hyella patelloides LEGE 07179]
MQIAWRIKIHHIAHIITASDNKVFALANHSKLLCLNSRTGEEYWSVNVINPWGWLALNSKTVFYLNQHDFLMAFDIDSGQQIWPKKLESIFGWLHASENSVIVGGWRGYTNLFCIDATTGKICWEFTTVNKKINRIFISENQLNVGIAFNNQSQIIFLELATGQQINQIKIDGIWTKANFDYIPLSSSGSWKGINRYLIFQHTESKFYRVDSNFFNVQDFEIEQKIKLQNIEEHSGLVPFIGQDNSLCIFSIKTNKSINIGKIQHNSQNILPIYIQNELSAIVGTSSGMIYHFDNTNRYSKIKVGKRISTSLNWSGNNLCFGTASGEIIGVSLE